MKKFFFAFLAFGVLAASSCKKEDSNTKTNTPPNANTPPTVSTPSDAFGVLAVVRVQTAYTLPVAVPGTPSSIMFSMGVASASFKDDVNATTLVDAGMVSVKDTVLSKVSNTNAYMFTPKGVPDGNNMGFSTNSSSFNWVVSGSSNVPAFNYTATGNFPVVGELTNSKDINTANSYTASLSTIPVYCDSVIWLMAGPSGSVQHVTPPQSSYTFTATEVGSLGKGDNVGLVQAAGFRITPFTKNSKKYYHVHEACATMSVSLK
ncbi:MAG: hypothetical protein M9931_10600 [Chitinophagales bacterium]|nr:hypothetical protein [Chitinophagales bacterium]